MAASDLSDSPRRPISGTAVAYDARIQIIGRVNDARDISPIQPGTNDFELPLREGLRSDPELRTRLDAKARRLFGAQFRAQALDVKVRDNVHVMAALHAERHTSVVVDSRQRVQLFAERLRQTISLVCRRGGFDVMIDSRAT